MFKLNPLMAIDFYKGDHRSQYPLNTEIVYSNGTPRSNRIFKAQWPKHDGNYVAFGSESMVRHFIQDFFNENFFKMPASVVVPQYKELIEDSLGVGCITFEHVQALHDLGFLPVRIKALPEGTITPMGVPYITIVNTLPEFFWITNYLETLLSAIIWKPMTAATIAREYRKLVNQYAKATGCTDAPLDLQCHDFSARGLSYLDDMTFTGMSHLVYFNGTDSGAAKQAIRYFHNAPPMTGVSVPATEHSVMCMGGKDDEIGTFERLLDLYPQGIVSIVSDTWDFWKVITAYTVILKDKILARKDIKDEDGNVLVPGRTVLRPDSGDPVKIITGYFPDEIFFDNGKPHCKETGRELADYEVKGAVQCLYEVFGGTKTKTKHIKLHDSIGLIYGDSITLDRCETIMKRLMAKGFASCNVTFGIGSFTYQYMTRDTLGFAIKATYGEVNGKGRNIQKNPKTDSGTKKSASGILVVKDGVLYQDQDNDLDSDLETIFENGFMTRKTDLTEIRQRAAV